MRSVDELRSRLLDRIDAFTGSGPGHRVTTPQVDGPKTGIAIVGCGFVADFYSENLPLHPDLRLIGCTDLQRERAERFAARNRCKVCASLDHLLADPDVEIVVNLTNPSSHAAVSRFALEAGKHVYTEKPLASDVESARELVELARSRGLLLSSAPCSVLGDSAVAMRAAVRRGDIGRVRLAYAELDDGPIHLMHPDEWASQAGTPWPWRDEFAVGCTLEHASYHLTWLVALFGSVERVTAFSRTVVPVKHPDLPSELCGPDFSTAAILFECGLVARLTCSVVAPHNHSLRLVGDDEVLEVDEAWHFGAPLTVRRFGALELRAETYPWLVRHAWTRGLFGAVRRRSDLSPKRDWRSRLRRHEMDYALGVAELAAALREKRPSRLSAELALHVTEISHAIASAGEEGATTEIKSRCSPF